MTPVDIEARTGLTEGNIFAGEFLAPQMYFFRPAPGWSQYRTPIDGYYQCGSGTHPGGCVIGSPGGWPPSGCCGTPGGRRARSADQGPDLEPIRDGRNCGRPRGSTERP